MAKVGYKSKQFKWEIESHFKEAKLYAASALNEAIGIAVTAGYEAAEQKLQGHPGSDPEHIREALTTEFRPLRGALVSPLWYSRFVEYGTVFTPAIGFMTRGYSTMRKRFVQVIGVEMAGAFRQKKVATRATTRQGLRRAVASGRITRREYAKRIKETR